MTITRFWMYGTVGQTYWGYVEVSGGVAPYSISIDVLPAGLALNPVPVNIFGGVPGGDFEFTGIPSAPGTTPVNITAVDSLGNTATFSDVFVVNTLEAPYMALPPAMIGAPYAFQYNDDFADAIFILAFGHPGVHPYAYSTSPPVIDGLFMDPTGLLSGAPTFALAPGQIGVGYIVAVIVDANGVNVGNATSNQIAFFNVPPPIPVIGVQIILRGVKRLATDGTASEPLQEIQALSHVQKAV